MYGATFSKAVCGPAEDLEHSVRRGPRSCVCLEMSQKMANVPVYPPGTMRCPPCNYLAPLQPHPITCPSEAQATWDESTRLITAHSCQ